MKQSHRFMHRFGATGDWSNKVGIGRGSKVILCGFNYCYHVCPCILVTGEPGVGHVASSSCC